MIWILQRLSAWLNAPYDWRGDLDRLRNDQDRKNGVDGPDDGRA